MFKNPINDSIQKIVEQIKRIKLSKFSDLLPAVINYMICIILLVLFSVLWIYGLISVIEQVIKSIIDTNLAEIANEKENGNAAIISYYIAIGLCFIIWFPFFILTIPLLFLGKISEFLFGKGAIFASVMIVTISIFIVCIVNRERIIEFLSLIFMSLSEYG